MARRHGSATALKASEVVAALAMGSTLHSHIGICQAVFFALLRLPSPRFPFPTDRATAADTPQTEMPWSLFLMAFPNVRSRWRWFGLWRPFLHLFLGSPSLSREGKFAGWVALLHSGHLAVLH